MRISIWVGAACIFVVLFVLFGLAYLNQLKLEGEVSHVLADLQKVAEHESAESFVDYIYKRRDIYPNLIILLAQRNKVTTLLGKEQYQTRWRAGTLRLVEWPVVPASASGPPIKDGAGPPQPYASGPITMTAYKGGPDTLLPIKLSARYVYFPESTGQPGLLLIVGRDMEAGAAFLHSAFITAFALFVFTPIFVAFSAYLTAKFVVRKIDEISETSANISGGDLTRRVPVGKRGDEFDRLSETLNRMLDQIQRLLNGMKEVSDNIAHDLRTPLVRLRGRIELALMDIDKKVESSGPRDALGVALEEAERLLLTFNALLSIARLEAGVMRENVEREDVGTILHDIGELYEPAAEDRGLRLTIQAPRGLFVRCNRELVVQALTNLVDNALKYSPEDTNVTLSARNVQPVKGDGRAIEVSVSDEGPGIPREDRERVLKRFVRLDRGRGAPGSGLGLSLVSAIAQLHEATLTLDDGPHGHGLTVRLVFAAI